MNRNRLRFASREFARVRHPYNSGTSATAIVAVPGPMHGLVVQVATLHGEYCPTCDVGALGPRQHFARCALTRGEL